MANTEGMPDEAMREMLTLDVDGASASSSASSSSSRTRRSGVGVGGRGGGPAAAASRAERLRKRDEAMRAQRERRQQQNLGGIGAIGLQNGAISGGVAEESKSNVTHTEQDTVTDDADAEQLRSRKEKQSQRLDAQPAFRLHPTRAQMMDSYVGADGGAAPAATVVRPSNRPPAVRSSKQQNGKGGNTEERQTGQKQRQQSMEEGKEEEKEQSRFEQQHQQQQTPSSVGKVAMPQSNLKPVIKSQSIQERPVGGYVRSNNMQQQAAFGGVGKKPSKFLQRRMMQQQQNSGGGGSNGSSSSSFIGGTAGGFPSLDVPIGTFARNNKGQRQRQQQKHAYGITTKDVVALGSSKVTAVSSSSQPTTNVGESTSISNNNDGADAMLAGMSRSEIMEGIAEIESALSEQSIAFLKARGRKKKKKASAVEVAKKKDAAVVNQNIHAKRDVHSRGNVTPTVKIDKEREAEILSSIKTEEELDRAYTDFNPDANTVLESSAPDVAAPGGRIQDLESATALLRSTSYRQTILAAKTTCELLKERVDAVKEASRDDIADIEPASSKDYPPLLPVALRCLLDLPQPHKHEQLHSYVLQSISCLVELFAHPSHRIYTNLDELERHSASVYQLDFMEDDVPVPPVGSCYKNAASLSAAQKLEDSPVDGALYATNSSAESAKKDGEAFYADPLWTLLSRMRITPCLSRIVASTKGRSTMPDEIVSTICIILSMLSLRSPGAACAIAQHKTLLPNLVDMTLTPGASYNGETKESFLVSPSIALPSLILLCTLARQSRTVASQTEPFASIISSLHAMLGMPAENDGELAVQRCCLILWRILLRYGLAIPHLATFILLAAPHLSIKDETKFSLTSDYLAAFANVCECAKVLTRSKSESSVRLTAEQADTLAMAGAWLSPHVQKCAMFLQEHASTGGQPTTRSNMKLIGARLRFLLSYVAASAPSDIMKLAVIEEETSGMKINDVDTSSFVSVVSRRACISSLDAILKSGMVKEALDLVLVYAYVTEWKGVLPIADTGTRLSLRYEASACSLLVAFVSLLSNLVNNESIFDNGQASDEEGRATASIANDFKFMVYSSLGVLGAGISNEVPVLSLARTGWVDAAQYAVVKFLSSSQTDVPNDDTELQQLRGMAFALLGRLKVGDESMAAVLLSQDVLFLTSSFSSKDEASPLQGMLLRELCNSQRSQGQLDHSFKLHRGHGITTAGKGPFGLESLRSEADFVAPPNRADEEENDNLSEPIIPLGKVWLWQVLSSTINPPPEASVQQRSVLLNDAAAVIISSLELLSCMEDGTASSSSHYSAQIHPGTKLYHLSNACLFPEEVLRHESFEDLFSSLFVSISSAKEATTEKSIPKAYVRACFRHSRTNRSKNKDDDDDIEREKLLALFDGNASSADEFSPKEVAALVDFVGDMSTTYMEYGAQYEALNHCMRFLLRPGFPSKARVEILTRLRGLLHSLTFQNEINDLAGESMRMSLERALNGGLPCKDGTLRESPDVLNAFAEAFSSGGINDNSRRLNAGTGGYAFFVAVALLARNYADSIESNEPGAEEAAKLRLQRLSDEAKTSVLGVTDRLLANGGGSKKDIVEAVLDVLVRDQKMGQQ